MLGIHVWILSEQQTLLTSLLKLFVFWIVYKLYHIITLCYTKKADKTAYRISHKEKEIKYYLLLLIYGTKDHNELIPFGNIFYFTIA